MFHIIGDFNITVIVQETPVLTFEKEQYIRKKCWANIYKNIFISDFYEIRYVFFHVI